MSGTEVVSRKEPLALRSFGFRMGSSGLSSDSKRRPAWRVMFWRRNHWSWRNRACSFWRVVQRFETQTGLEGDVLAQEPLVLEEQGLLLLAEAGASGLFRGQAAEAAELAVLVPPARD
jgi:hypothetical protein